MGTRLVAGIVRFLHGEGGVTAIEYGLLAALVALAIVVGATALGGGLDNMFNNVAARLAAL